MQQTHTKTKNIKYIPTELNFINYTQKRLNRQARNIHTSRLLIIALIIWNICTTVLICQIPKEITKDAAVIPVEMLQEIPLNELQ